MTQGEAGGGTEMFVTDGASELLSSKCCFFLRNAKEGASLDTARYSMRKDTIEVHEVPFFDQNVFLTEEAPQPKNYPILGHSKVWYEEMCNRGTHSTAFDQNYF